MVMPDNPAITGMICFYSQWLYPIFERIGTDESQKLSEQASKISAENPLHCMGHEDKTWELPHLGACSPGKVLAILPAYIVWFCKSSNKDALLPDSPLIQAADLGYKMWKMQISPPKHPINPTQKIL